MFHVGFEKRDSFSTLAAERQLPGPCEQVQPGSPNKRYAKVPVAAKLRELISKLLFLGGLRRNFTLGINKFLAFLALYPNLKLSVRTMGILV
ncbi:unnamed protein product [Porites evermanni]|uniref:Uncharacterized protein n=1 Tax=Porites evermanni TaxID=104178 RepID=A0ABN8LPH8_9CNID|nr:unnamed protein product [Porites evermanni]